jgi:uncharacterized membrane protein YbhN (UPF0104 family)
MDRIKQLLRNPRLRSWLVAIILIVTIIVFIRFFTQHPAYLRSLKHVKLWQIGAILGLNVGVLLSLVGVYSFSLELCGTRIPLKEQFLLTSYSSIANFFGPLQSGPGVRSVYLKTKHKVKMREYLLATLIYYAMFAMISMLFLVGGSRPWWQAILALIAVALVCWGVIQLFLRRSAKKGKRIQLIFSRRALIGLLLSTFAQICFVTGYYFVELIAVKSHASLHQAVIYSGAANFAIFVSLTPDAIGFRESFLVLSKRLHHLTTPIIFAANLLDRAVYALFLGLLFLVVLAMHAKDKLGIKAKDSGVLKNG